jgi:hypothetical protein
MYNECYNRNQNLPHSDFDEVVERLYESIVLNPCGSNCNQENFMHNASERKDQIIYYLNKTLAMPHHAKLATDLANALSEDDIIRY